MKTAVSLAAVLLMATPRSSGAKLQPAESVVSRDELDVALLEKARLRDDDVDAIRSFLDRVDTSGSLVPTGTVSFLQRHVDLLSDSRARGVARRVRALDDSQAGMAAAAAVHMALLLLLGLVALALLIVVIAT